MIPKTLVIGLLAAASCSGQPLTVSITLIDSYGAPKGVVLRASKDATRILAVAGVRLDWAHASQPAAITLYLLSREMVPTSGSALGYTSITPGARGGSSFAHLLYPAIERTAQIWEVNVSTVLGAAVAHEIGHILLNSTMHSRSGVMSAVFGLPQLQQAGKNQLVFSAEQAALIRLGIGQRPAEAIIPEIGQMNEARR